MFKSCCKKDDIGPSPLRLSSNREEGSVFRRSTSSDVSNMSRRGLTDVSNVRRSRGGLYDMSDIQLPPLPPRCASYPDEGSRSRRKSDGGISGSRRKSDEGSASRRRSNVGREAAQSSPSSDMDNEEAYAQQCQMCAETAVDFFNNSAAAQGGVTYEVVDTGVSVGFMHKVQGVVYHSNFHVIAANAPPGTPTLVLFAELWEIYPYPPRVTSCSILGTTGSVFMGLNGCQACSSNPDRPTLHHPADGSFDVGEEHFLIFEDDRAPHDR